MLRLRNVSRSLKKAIIDPGYAVQVFRKRLMAYLYYRLGRGYAGPPETISLFLTYKCNLRCKMCGQWGEDGWARKLPPEAVSMELSLENIERLLDDIDPWKPAITLFGGEPLLYTQWENLVRRIKSRGLRVNMITNGTLLGRYARAVVDLGVDELIFSLDGPEDIHDEMRSGKGIFRKAVDAFTEVTRYRTEAGRENPRIHISTTIFETNYRRLNEVVDVAESFGADTITFHHLIFLSSAMCERHSKVFNDEFGIPCSDWTGFARDTLPNIDSEYLISTFAELKKRKSRTGIAIYPNFTDDDIRKYYGGFEFTSRSYTDRCISPWMTVYIFPNGDVKPCLDICFVPGSIDREPFRKIWNNVAYRKYRSSLHRHGSFPGCKRCTELYRS